MLVCLFALLVYDLISWCTSFSFFFFYFTCRKHRKVPLLFVAVDVNQSVSAKIHLLLLSDLSGVMNAALAEHKKKKR